MLRKDAEHLSALAKKGKLDYELELSINDVLKIERTAETPFPISYARRSESLEKVPVASLQLLRQEALLQLVDPLSIQNEVNLISFEKQPMIVYQIINEGFAQERILNRSLYQAYLSTHSQLTQKEIEERIRFNDEPTFRIHAVQDHILALDNNRLYSTDTRDFPEVE